MVKELKLASPWVITYRLYKAMFGEDPEITIEFDNDTPEIKLFVENEEKADALMKLLPQSIDFGNVVMCVTVIPANADTDKSELFKKAFAGNPAFKDSMMVEQYGGGFLYNVFAKKVVQYISDDIGDVYSVESTLYEDIAREIFGEVPGVFYCTEVDEDPIR